MELLGVGLIDSPEGFAILLFCPSAGGDAPSFPFWATAGQLRLVAFHSTQRLRSSCIRPPLFFAKFSFQMLPRQYLRRPATKRKTARYLPFKGSGGSFGPEILSLGRLMMEEISSSVAGSCRAQKRPPKIKTIPLSFLDDSRQLSFVSTH